MTKVIIIPDEDLDTFYERTMRYLHRKYHTYPSATGRFRRKKDDRKKSTQLESGKKSSGK